jgi:hypothetical protein
VAVAVRLVLRLVVFQLAVKVVAELAAMLTE